jgi:predicted phage terminase large subunit-like protein
VLVQRQKRRDWVDPEQAEKDRQAALREQRAEIALLERQARIYEAREHLLPFTQFTMPDPEAPNDVNRTRYSAARFHEEVAKALEAVERGEIVQLIFCMPPRHGKTELATKRFAAWYWGRQPDHKVAVASYSDGIAWEYGADTRAIIASTPYRQVFPDLKLRRGGNAKDNLETVQGGRMVFVGRGGALTGKGAHLLLLDDLFKDHEEARSQATRDAAWNWFTKVAMTRRMGKKLVVITMTRWHSDDIIGRITDPENPHYKAEFSKRWKIIRLPAIAEEDDPLGREEGEPLWPDGPDRFDLDFLEDQRTLDPLGFASLYQQRPTVADGVLFRRENIQRYKPGALPENLRFYCASDHAVGTKQRNDKSCFGKAGVDAANNLWLVDLFWDRVSTDRAVEAMLTMAGGAQKPLYWWAERGHISQSIGPFLRKRMLETQNYINVIEITPATDKEQRAQSMAARVGMQKVFIPEGAIWDRAVEELLAFPNGTHDDFVDMMSLFGLGLQSQFGRSSKPLGGVKSKQPAYGTLAWIKQQDKLSEERRRPRNGGF